MIKNNQSVLFGATSSCLAVGGQAVLEGIMIRNGDLLSIAVRNPQGQIVSSKINWLTLGNFYLLSLPFIRGFIILLESILNGLIGLNFSARIAENSQADVLSVWKFFLSLFLAIIMAIALFILVPHFLALFMLNIGFGTDVTLPIFHLWDGFFKCAIFIVYIYLISFVPDIYRLFQYHGAEHKIVQAWEKGFGVDYYEASSLSTLHPRCGTTFILFVICISIIMQGLFVPLILNIWMPESTVIKHGWTIFIKLVLIVPISAVSYEIIRFASLSPVRLWAMILLAPGLFLQKLTTREPTLDQLEVAAVALYWAVYNNQDIEK